MRLLNLSRSFVNGPASMREYRFLKPHPLPVFGPRRHRSPQRPGAAPVPLDALLGPSGHGMGEARVKAVSAMSDVGEALKPARVPAPAGVGLAREGGRWRQLRKWVGSKWATSVAGVTGAGRWVAARCRIGRNPFGTAPEEVERPRLPVQGALALDAVRVVRNDLRDSDAEVETPVATVTKIAGTKGLKPAGGDSAKPVGDIWREFISARARTPGGG